MSRLISRAEGFETAYEAFQQINFAAFDYNTIKESMIDYVKLYFPEDFNDYIESSEFIAILELFAYLGELLAYRIDINAHENFITTAQRKQNILRLAKLISYNSTRNLPARGLVKLTSISCSEHVYDSDGVDLINRVITWNDQNNPKWKEQFLLVINRILQQDFGTVSPNDRVQVDDVLFELYELRNDPATLTNGVFSFNVSVSGEQFPMELVPVTLNESGPTERRPDTTQPFSILYASDGLGDSSDTTGFFMFAKQGTLQSSVSTFDGITPNQTLELVPENINDIDVWANKIDPDTSEVLESWEQVDIAHAQNIIFNTNTNRQKFEVESLEDDKIRLIFGDGEFSDIPSGSFQVWSRSSANADVVIPRNTIDNVGANFSYTDTDSNVQSFAVTYSLTSTLQNASTSEDIEHIRRVAPAVYYSQDRMVNARDYNTFMLQDPSILKLRAVNRTYSGESKYITWNDPSDTYENVKTFGDDLVLFYEKLDIIKSVFNVSETVLLDSTIEPLLSDVDVFLSIALIDPHRISSRFLATEKDYILNGTSGLNPNVLVGGLNGMLIGDDAYIVHGDHAGDQTIWWDIHDPTLYASKPSNAIFEVSKISATEWQVSYVTTKMIIHSEDTEFWNTNEGGSVITYDTLNNNSDKLVLLQANADADRTALLPSNLTFEAIKQVTYSSGLPDAGLPNTHELQIITEDADDDNVPDDVDLSVLLNKHVNIGFQTGPLTVPLAQSYIAGFNDIEVYDISTTPGTPILLTLGVDYTEVEADGDVSSDIEFTAAVSAQEIEIVYRDFVYFHRESTLDPWIPTENNETVMALFSADIDIAANPTAIDDEGVGTGDSYKRLRGRDDLNFLWTHFTSRYNLVDPSTTNLIDMFIISKGFHTSTKSWLEGTSTIEPEAPTPLQLRTDYANLLDNKMISDTVILHPGRFKVLFGEHAAPELQAKFVVVTSSNKTLTDNQIKVKMVNTIRNFFDITTWEFGETFYYTELGAAIQTDLPNDVDSVVLVPLQSSNVFGDLFQVYAQEDEIFQPSISVNDIEIVESLNAVNIKQSRT